MEPPFLLRLLLLLSSSVSWLLLARGSAAIGALEGIGADEWTALPLGLGRNFRNGHTRRLLQIHVGSNVPSSLPPKYAPPIQKKYRSHRHKQQPKPVDAPSPSPLSASPKAPSSSSASAPAISPSRSYHPQATPPQHPPSPLPSIPHPPHKHSWRDYSLVAAGSAAFFVMAAASIMYCRVKKVGTVRPWATGLSGQLQRAFVTGVPALKRSELQAASEDFSNIVGSTPNCTVYKGTLSSGVEIAIVSSSIASVKDWSKVCESHYRKKVVC